jgi:CHASE3 domain sensor protein
MGIRKRLATFVFFMTGLLVLVGGLLLVGGPVILSAYQQSLDSMDSLDAIRELRANVSRQRTSLNRYLLLDDTQEWLSFEEATRQARTSINSMKSDASKRNKGWIPDLVKLYETTEASAEMVITHYKKGNKEDGAYEYGPGS